LPLLILLLTARSAHAQSTAAWSPLEAPAESALGKAPGLAPLCYADEMPHYVGGGGAMLAFFQKWLTYSSEAIAHLKTGIIYVSFVVDALGRTIDPQVIKGVGYATALMRKPCGWCESCPGGSPVKCGGGRYRPNAPCLSGSELPTAEFSSHQRRASGRCQRPCRVSRSV